MIDLVYMENIETWADLNCYDIKPDMYMISTFGRVMNKYTGLILQQWMINSGYMTVYLRCDGVNRDSARFLVHRLVLLTFNPSIPDPENYTVNHEDCIKDHNNLFNLEWMTQKENNDYKYLTHTDNSTGEDNINARISNDQARIICEELEKGTKYKDILLKIGYTPIDHNDTMYDLITNIKMGNSWKHISKDYDFSNVIYNHSNYSNEQIEYICQCLGNGMSTKDIYNSMHDDEYKGSKQNKSFYEMVRRIKNGQQFVDIASKYIHFE